LFLEFFSIIITLIVYFFVKIQKFFKDLFFFKFLLFLLKESYLSYLILNLGRSSFSFLKELFLLLGDVKNRFFGYYLLKLFNLFYFFVSYIFNYLVFFFYSFVRLVLSIFLKSLSFFFNLRFILFIFSLIFLGSINFFSFSLILLQDLLLYLEQSLLVDVNLYHFYYLVYSGLDSQNITFKEIFSIFKSYSLSIPKFEHNVIELIFFDPEYFTEV
jgi:hypothetical protein